MSESLSECGVWDGETDACPCGHDEHQHDREANPELCMVCGDADSCATPPAVNGGGTS